ncbi:hypothetical protein [Streptomyces capitiformicae]|uniref:Uncharacterized protein n=1 Tax=Streptomyces capitiformicae TaxID=2014920 RepID=A0A919GFP7_9ACTN|nr:hypothetical protein [Streptomyces capitiformicae]GHH83780.1 hypothetical protein GCM10017771_11250 [Streptomyces capitiformicae]
MTVADYLIGTSALARVLLRQNTAAWDDRIGVETIARTTGQPVRMIDLRQ